LAAKIDDVALENVWRNRDAVKGQELVCEALRLEKPYVERILEEHRRIREAN